MVFIKATVFDSNTREREREKEGKREKEREREEEVKTETRPSVIFYSSTHTFMFK
jgi:hypothetical protein